VICVTAARLYERRPIPNPAPHRGGISIPADPEKEDIVSVLIRFSPPSLTGDQYDQVVGRLNDAGVFPAEGLDYEICFGSDGNLKVSQVWDTQEQLEAFGARLMPILSEMGINPGEPEIVEVHNIIHRGERG
jgi:hypothetical protein